MLRFRWRPIKTSVGLMTLRCLRRLPLRTMVPEDQLAQWKTWRLQLMPLRSEVKLVALLRLPWSRLQATVLKAGRLGGSQRHAHSDRRASDVDYGKGGPGISVARIGRHARRR